MDNYTLGLTREGINIVETKLEGQLKPVTLLGGEHYMGECAYDTIKGAGEVSKNVFHVENHVIREDKPIIDGRPVFIGDYTVGELLAMDHLPWDAPDGNTKGVYYHECSSTRHRTAIAKFRVNGTERRALHLLGNRFPPPEGSVALWLLDS